MLIKVKTHITPRLRLRDWRVDDLQVYAHWLRPGQQWQTLDAPYYKQDHSPEEIIQIITRMRKRIEASSLPTPRRNLVIARYDTDTFIGIVSWYWISEETHWPAIGIVIHDPDNWRQGYGYEALGLWCEYIFQAGPHFARLDLRTWSGNSGMMRLAEKLGFQQEARFRNARIVNGEFYDGMGYGMLRSEWEIRYPDGFAASLTTNE